MDRVIGGVLGLAAFIAVLALSAAKGVSVGGSLFRAVVAMVLGYWIGRLIFGIPGLAVVKEAAGPVPPPPPAPAESKSTGTAPGQAPPPKS